MKILMKSGFGLGSEREKLCILSFEDFGCGRNDVVARGAGRGWGKRKKKE